jgi:cytidylate kinase
VSAQEAETGVIKRSLVGRFFGVLAPLAGGVLGAGTDAAPPDAVPPPDDAELFREQAETIMRQALDLGAVILGRGGAAAFHDRPDVLRVRLFGPVEARVAHAMGVQQVDEQTARRRLPEVDHARAQYVRRLYGVDIDDADLFTVQLDSTALSTQACVEIIATAYANLAVPEKP